jgi:hypothetical protein
MYNPPQQWDLLVGGGFWGPAEHERFEFDLGLTLGRAEPSAGSLSGDQKPSRSRARFQPSAGGQQLIAEHRQRKLANRARSTL